MSRSSLRSGFVGAAVVVATSSCQCDVPFTKTFAFDLTSAVGGSSVCALSDEEVDGNGDAINRGDFGEVHYNYEHDGTAPFDPTNPDDPNLPTHCTVHVVSWSGPLADLDQVRDDIKSGVAEQGLDPDSAVVVISDVEFGAVSLDVNTADGDGFDLAGVGPYNAHMNVVGGDASVDDVLVIDHEGTGDVEDGDVTTTSDTAGVAAVISDAINNGDDLDGSGHADVDFAFADLAELTGNGDAAPEMTVSVELTVTGSLKVSP